ncbi:hypothetical protein SAMN05877962_10714 [Alloalcanivorax xenomutans]|uniref:hypothetical protein n=1 Tax=Alloalcanivorax xenomutans TaxID=1094342 RepID=UPI000BCC407D|nr:hypothetical protein [Alloalcanivorax xenomutans]SOC05404.1 hypothetical protein SAMN05877962_10714 [Alloalcanivorax xenomutans]
MTYRADVLTTPLGPMMALVDDQGALVRLEFVDGQHHPASVHWRGLSMFGMRRLSVLWRSNWTLISLSN